MADEVNDGDYCHVTVGTHKGKKGVVQNKNTSKTGAVTITVTMDNGDPLRRSRRMSSRAELAFALLLLAACDSGHAASDLPVVPEGIQADRIVVDKSERLLMLYAEDKEIARYTGIRFGDAPVGHKQFESDEKTPEGKYTINGRNPKSSYHLSLRISYPNAADVAFAKLKGKSAGGDIFIHGQPNRWIGPTLATDWTDGCIAVSNAEIEQIWKLVPDGVEIEIKP